MQPCNTHTRRVCEGKIMLKISEKIHIDWKQNPDPKLPEKSDPDRMDTRVPVNEKVPVPIIVEPCFFFSRWREPRSQNKIASRSWCHTPAPAPFYLPQT